MEMPKIVKETLGWFIGVVIAGSLIVLGTMDYIDTRTKAKAAFDNAVRLQPIHQNLQNQFNKIAATKAARDAAAAAQVPGPPKE